MLYTASVADIALAAATAKTIAELVAGANDRVKIVEWGLTFDGVTAANTPVKCEIGKFSAAITTGTTLTITTTQATEDDADGPPNAVIKHTATVEGAGTPRASVKNVRVPPTQGFLYQAPLGRESIIALSGNWRIRCTAAQIVNVSFWLTWDE